MLPTGLQSHGLFQAMLREVVAGLGYHLPSRRIMKTGTVDIPLPLPPAPEGPSHVKNPLPEIERD